MSTESAAGRASLYLARHGQTAYNREHRFQGHLPVPLDRTGRAQAAELAERAAGHRFAALWCSPLLRARQTAEVVAARIGLRPREDARLAETDSGDWTDRLFSDVQADSPDEFARFAALDRTFAFPGGESFAAQSARVAEALRHVAAGPGPALVVCHGVVIRLALLERMPAAELPPRIPNAAMLPLAPPAAEAGGRAR